MGQLSAINAPMPLTSLITCINSQAMQCILHHRHTHTVYPVYPCPHIDPTLGNVVVGLLAGGLSTYPMCIQPPTLAPRHAAAPIEPPVPSTLAGHFDSGPPRPFSGRACPVFRRLPSLRLGSFLPEGSYDSQQSAVNCYHRLSLVEMIQLQNKSIARYLNVLKA